MWILLQHSAQQRQHPVTKCHCSLSSHPWWAFIHISGMHMLYEFFKKHVHKRISKGCFPFRWSVFCLASVGKSMSFSSTLPMWSPLQKRWLSSAQPFIFISETKCILLTVCAFLPGWQQGYRGCLGRRWARARGDRQIPACGSTVALQ